MPILLIIGDQENLMVKIVGIWTYIWLVNMANRQRVF